jgi:hypothetical protein
MRRRDVADIGDAVAHDDLPAAKTIEIADGLNAFAVRAGHASLASDLWSTNSNCGHEASLRSRREIGERQSKGVGNLSQLFTDRIQ